MTNRWKNTQEKAIAASYVSQLLEYAEKNGVSAEQIIAGCQNVSLKNIHEAKGYIGLNDYKLIIKNATQALNDPNLVFTLTKNTSATGHGFLGLAILCGLSLKHTLNLLMRYYRTRSGLIELKMTKDSQLVTLSVNPILPLDETELFSITSVIAVIYQCKRDLLPNDLPPDQVNFTFSEPANAENYREFFHNRINFNAGQNSIQFPVEQLDIKLKSGNSQTVTSTEGILDREIEEISTPNLTLAVQEILSNSKGLPNAKEVAQQMFLSERTLRRQLAAQNTSFQAILDNHRSQQAQDLLRNTNTPITQIAHQLGFDDASNFSKAFKRWTGSTPREYRQRSSM